MMNIGTDKFFFVDNNIIANLSNFNELKKAIKILKEYHIGVLAHMVFGNDFDTREGIRTSLQRLMELDIATATLGIVVPYPGTKLYKELEKQNRIITRDWNFYDIHHLVFNPLNFSIGDFLQEMFNIRAEFFSYSNILKRSWSFKSLEVMGINIHSHMHNKVGNELEY